MVGTCVTVPCLYQGIQSVDYQTTHSLVRTRQNTYFSGVFPGFRRYTNEGQQILTSAKLLEKHI